MNPFKLLTTLSLALTLLSGCAQYQANQIDRENDKPADQKDYVGPGGMSQYKKDKDTEFKKKRTSECQDAQIDLAEAKSANDKAAIERAMQLIQKSCAEAIKAQYN